MKTAKILLSAFIFIMPVVFYPQSVLAETGEVDSRIGIDLGIEYHSLYFWRGISFYGDYNGDGSSHRGVFFPWIGYGISDFYFLISGEIPSAALGGNATDTEKQWYGIDFIVKWNRSFYDEALSLEIFAAYYLYPNSRKSKYDGGISDDSIDAGVALTASALPLSPAVSVIYSYIFKEQFAGQKKNRNIYAEFSVSHDFELMSGVTFTAGGAIATFYYASAGFNDDWQKISDIRFFSKITVKMEYGLSIYGRYNYGLVPADELQAISGTHHHWAAFGVSYSL